jgi:hypothetical protein
VRPPKHQLLHLMQSRQLRPRLWRRRWLLLLGLGLLWLLLVLQRRLRHQQRLLHVLRRLQLLLL